MTPADLVATGLAGGAGALARFTLDAAISARSGRGLPFGTFVVNVSGAFVLGLVTGLALHGTALLVVGSGAIGGYTTFSTWAFESHRLAEDGQSATGAANLLVALAAGLGAVALGRALG